MVDVHCHLNFHAFKHDYDKVIKDAFAAGVTKIINVGTQISSSKRTVELAQQYDNLYAIVGIHPHHADKLTLKGHPEPARLASESTPSAAKRVSGSHESQYKTSGDSHGRVKRGTQNDSDDWLSKLEHLAKQPKVVAIGEIGLDNYRYKSNGISDPKTQREIFIKQIELAYKLKLPLQIHNRHAGKEILDILLNHKLYLLNPPGMFHCMSGDIEFLKKVLDLGFYVGFDGNITYQGIAPGEAVELSELVKYAPLDRIVTETDSPYLAPVPHRGSRNIPSYVILVGEFIAHIKGISVDKMREQTTHNPISMFKNL